MTPPRGRIHHLAIGLWERKRGNNVASIGGEEIKLRLLFHHVQIQTDLRGARCSQLGNFSPTILNRAYNGTAGSQIIAHSLGMRRIGLAVVLVVVILHNLDIL